MFKKWNTSIAWFTIIFLPLPLLNNIPKEGITIFVNIKNNINPSIVIQATIVLFTKK